MKSFFDFLSKATVSPPSSMQLHCCGVENYTDWNSTDYFKDKGIPVSCCLDNSKCSPESLKDLSLAGKEVYTTVGLLMISQEPFDKAHVL